MAHKILIVDDEPALLLILKGRLEAEQYQVVTAGDADEGLAKFKSEKPNLVITDVMMPGLSGYEFFEALRKLGGEGATVPVIVTSARGSMSQFFDTWAITAFVPKPFDMPLLVKKVKEAMPAPVLTHPVAKAAPVPIKGEQRTALLAGVSEFELRKMKDFLEQNLCTVVQGLDEEDAFRTARKLKPDFIFFEFWEDPTRFDAAKLLHYLKADSITQQIPYAVFCKPALVNDANKSFNTKHLLVACDAAELVNHLESLMQTPEFRKRSY